MIKNTILAALAGITIAGCCAEESPPPKTSEQILTEIARRSPEMPAPLDGQFSIEVEIVRAKNLSEPAAGNLLQAAASTDSARYAKPDLFAGPDTPANTSLKVIAWPTVVTRLDSKEGADITFGSPGGKIAMKATPLAQQPDANGYIPFRLHLTRTEGGAAPVENACVANLRAGEVLLLSDTPEPHPITASIPNPLIMHIVPGTRAGDLAFIRVLARF